MLPMPRRLFVLASALLLSLAAFAHAYHASIMDVKVNAQKKQLEVALKVFTDDLEKGLSVGQPRPISLDQTPPFVVQPLVAAYLRKTIVFTGKPSEEFPLKYIGMERENDAHWLYFSVALPRPLQGVRLQQRLLLEQFPDQMNIVNVEASSGKKSALFRNGNEAQLLSW
ncbi:hypothetical protein F0P96_05635 [Hymenobacter busanensis]|uniref:Uncharacterized protein n=1 Tax=Hymenobacter busanensis TaxID=2607656 RepID=A0A7L5A4S2_9BACT|nr:DUF6702 family protein [Hymenobacter busanensis]KAA9338316.1 hypothetical protein F0P96_05635 [Hymenobacter busanensis]QHJ09260.1 hypothetical protein GUY19_18975 [Hymenobacter busanensis]